jgi:hypothetical protein
MEWLFRWNDDVPDVSDQELNSSTDPLDIIQV